MSENIATRVGRLVSGGFNAIVDAVENAAPETVMEQAIREVDSAIDEVRAELGKVIANKHLASNRLMEENRKHEEISENVRIALKEGREDLAETAVAQQMDIEAQIPVLESSITDAGNQEKELEGYISALKAKRREMEGELAEFRASRQTTPGTSTAGEKPAGSGTESKVERASATFDRVMNRQSGMPGSTTPDDRKTASQLAELDELARKNRVQERLAKLKAEIDEK